MQTEMCHKLATSVETKLQMMGIDMEGLEQHVQECSTSTSLRTKQTNSTTSNDQHLMGWYANRLLSDMQNCKQARHNMSAQLSKLAAEPMESPSDDETTDKQNASDSPSSSSNTRPNTAPNTTSTFQACTAHAAGFGSTDVSSLREVSISGGTLSSHHRVPSRTASAAKLPTALSAVGPGAPGSGGPAGHHRPPGRDRSRGTLMGLGWASKVNKALSLVNNTAEVKVNHANER